MERDVVRNTDLLLSFEMKLPGGEYAVVDINKLRDYCLNPVHLRGRHKARVFLSEELLRMAREGDALKGATDQFGNATRSIQRTYGMIAAQLFAASGLFAEVNVFRGWRLVMYY